MISRYLIFSFKKNKNKKKIFKSDRWIHLIGAAKVRAGEENIYNSHLDKTMLSVHSSSYSYHPQTRDGWISPCRCDLSRTNSTCHSHMANQNLQTPMIYLWLCPNWAWRSRKASEGYWLLPASYGKSTSILLWKIKSYISWSNRTFVQDDSKITHLVFHPCVYSSIFI